MFLLTYRHFFAAAIKVVRNFHLTTMSYVDNKNHYQSLGLTPHATQADIKSAYYKLSMQYHPDKNKGSEQAAEAFRDITAAYEVLGNLKLRKMYDKGIIHTAGPQFAQQEENMSMEDDSQAKFYKSRAQRSKAPPPSGKSSIYDFDEWTQAHYGSSFARREAAKARYERKIQTESSHRETFATESIFFGAIAFLTLLYLTYIQKDDYDVPMPVVDNVNKHSNEVQSAVPVEVLEKG